MKLDLLKQKTILILGLGREGKSSLRFLRRLFPNKKIGLADQVEFKKLNKNLKKLIKLRNIKAFLGPGYLEAIKKYEVIIKTPGIPTEKIKPYLSENHILTSQTDIFLENYGNQVIGITGTKGKSTTSTLIYEILKKGGKRVELIGNIGKPPLDFFKKGKRKCLFVFELSSHQLQGLKISPKIAVFLNIYKEHLDYYKNFQEYFSTKRNITRWQTEKDIFIFNYEISALRKLASQTKAKTIPFGFHNKKGCYLKNGWIVFEDTKILPIKEIPLKGRHNLLNVMAAVTVSSVFDISPNIIRKVVCKFKSLEHRLEFVGRFKGVSYYNDSLATVPEATMEALEALQNIETLMLGGYERKQDFTELIKMIIKKKIPNLILFPETGKRIYKEIQKIATKKYKPKCFLVNNMEEAVKTALKVTKKGTCLLSPASASFGLFKDYKDRGDQFKKYLQKLAKK
ncbi:UDP-N-acetylmuramoyl-L-alanine--D-glutamate ligase [bacterium]|nr:UDP-N-acetylmuramoyl-L-alanine--D-glutamate ligase [bacterium]